LVIDRVEQFMQRRNVEVSLSYYVIVVTPEEHEPLLTDSHSENILVDLADSTDMNGSGVLYWMPGSYRNHN